VKPVCKKNYPPLTATTIGEGGGKGSAILQSDGDLNTLIDKRILQLEL
jgi:predicted lipoprotein with Yx(FWY)xxD motif